MNVEEQWHIARNIDNRSRVFGPIVNETTAFGPNDEPSCQAKIRAHPNVVEYARGEIPLIRANRVVED